LKSAGPLLDYDTNKYDWIGVPMKTLKIWLGLCLVAWCSVCAPAFAQTFLKDLAAATPGATQLQKNAAIAINDLCVTLNALKAQTPLGDLDRRCTELVVTAGALLFGAANVPPVHLDVSTTRVLQILQQDVGEETLTSGRVVTQAPAAQFSNITGRLDALRLGGFSSLSRGAIAGLDP
jgi:hypothetical protein